jgi:hypothetical protein
MKQTHPIQGPFFFSVTRVTCLLTFLLSWPLHVLSPLEIYPQLGHFSGVVCIAVLPDGHYAVSGDTLYVVNHLLRYETYDGLTADFPFVSSESFFLYC